jgi:hypothetical protein
MQTQFKLLLSNGSICKIPYIDLSSFNRGYLDQLNHPFWGFMSNTYLNEKSSNKRSKFKKVNKK